MLQLSPAVEPGILFKNQFDFKLLLTCSGEKLFIVNYRNERFSFQPI